MKRILSIAIVSVMLLSVIPAFGVSASEAAGNLTDIKFKYDSDTTYYVSNGINVITGGWTEPVFKTAEEGGITDSTAAGYYSATNLSSYFRLFADTNDYQYNYLYSAPDALKDATYIQLKKGWRGNPKTTEYPNNNPECTDVLSFKIDKSAEIYYIFPNQYESSIATYAPWLNTDGWSALENVTVAESNGATEELSSNVLKTHLLLSKKIKVNEGETATVNIGGFKNNYFVPMVFVRWIDDPTEFGEISNAKFKKYQTTAPYYTLTDIPSSNIYTEGFSADKTFYATADNNVYFSSIPEYLKDADFIKISRAWGGGNNKTYREDTNNPNSQNSQSEVLSFDINMTANVYYVPMYTAYSNTGTYTSWVLDEEWSRCEGTASFEETSKTTNCVIYKKKFIVEPGETVNIKIGGYKNNYYVPFVFIDWVNEEETGNVEVVVGEGGYSYWPGNQDAVIGGSYTAECVPESGKVIEKIIYNDTVIPVGSTTSYKYTISETTGDDRIEYVLIDAPVSPEISVYNSPFKAKDENGGNEAYLFARATDYITGYTRAKFGMLFTENETSEEGFVIGAENIIDIEGTTAPNKMGQYGIKITGSKLVPGTYYTKAYAVYTNDETSEETVIYGDTISFTISE